MRKISKYEKKICLLKNKQSFTTKEASLLGVPKHALDRLCKKNEIIQVERGLYQVSEYISDIDPKNEDVAIAAASIPNSVICLISALSYYELTDQIPRENWLAIPNSQRAPKRKHTRVIRMRNISLGLNTVEIGPYKLKIFNKERSIVDAFRYLDDEIGLQALRMYINNQQSKADIQKVIDYSKKLRHDVTQYVRALTL